MHFSTLLFVYLSFLYQSGLLKCVHRVTSELPKHESIFYFLSKQPHFGTIIAHTCRLVGYCAPFTPLFPANETFLPIHCAFHIIFTSNPPFQFKPTVFAYINYNDYYMHWVWCHYMKSIMTIKECLTLVENLIFSSQCIAFFVYRKNPFGLGNDDAFLMQSDENRLI